MFKTSPQWPVFALPLLNSRLCRALSQQHTGLFSRANGRFESPLNISFKADAPYRNLGSKVRDPSPVCYNKSMTRKLIIIRGNSGSGKSTIASRVRNNLGNKVMFLQQDVLRRDILKVKDKEGNPVIGLIEQLVVYGREIGYDVIIEGILSEGKYGSMLRKLVANFDTSHVYYLDISFDETLRRHNLRGKNNDFGEVEMREWWREKDYLGVSDERILSEDLSEDGLVELILSDISKESRP